MLLLIKYTLLYGIVLMLVALGGMFSEHSGIINIALEGIMVIGGVAGVLTLTMLPADMSPFLVVLISVLVAALVNMVYSLLLAFASINLKADQTIGGTALNLLATAIAVVIAKYFSDSGSAAELFQQQAVPVQHRRPGAEHLLCRWASCCSSSTMWCCTRPASVLLRAYAEHPQAADSVGINVYKMRTTLVCCFPVRWALSAVWHISCPLSRPGTLRSAWLARASLHWLL